LSIDKKKENNTTITNNRKKYTISLLILSINHEINEDNILVLFQSEKFMSNESKIFIKYNNNNNTNTHFIFVMILKNA
jgi:hypothetical protein